MHYSANSILTHDHTNTWIWSPNNQNWCLWGLNSRRWEQPTSAMFWTWGTKKISVNKKRRCIWYLPLKVVAIVLEDWKARVSSLITFFFATAGVIWFVVTIIAIVFVRSLKTEWKIFRKWSGTNFENGPPAGQMHCGWRVAHLLFCGHMPE